MKYLASFICAALVALAAPAFAQSAATGSANSSSGAQSYSGVSIDGHNVSNYRGYVPTAIAPGLTASAPCMGSSSIGGSGSGFGFAFGTTWKDRECETRENSRYMGEFTGRRDVAVRIMCTNPEIAKAVPDVCGVEVTSTGSVVRASSKTRVVRRGISWAECRRMAAKNPRISCRRH